MEIKNVQIIYPEALTAMANNMKTLPISSTLPKQISADSNLEERIISEVSEFLDGKKNGETISKKATHVCLYLNQSANNGYYLMSLQAVYSYK